ncbi:MAG: ketoglutarate semialdehyde dehydrogenase [Planctomycetota bacterium]|nr:MAG: ketoglutarate semialdehyde dehydrogenase [Planctomycetota bacterium]
MLIDGRWQPSTAAGVFQARNPMTGVELPALFPVSRWDDCDRALEAAHRAYRSMSEMPDGQIAEFLDGYATGIEEEAETIVAQAHVESGLPIKPRLRDVELPRTVDQLRQAAAAAREGSWRMPTIDTRANIRSFLASIGPVCVFGPSNFPLAFGSVSGGDFAAALAAGNPVIAKAHPLHPETARLMATIALQAVAAAGLPPATVQLLYHLEPEDGERMVSDRRLAASAFTGSRAAGLRLKRAADAAGKLIYLELSSINPVVILPGALAERGAEIADEFCTSALLGGGQFCTNPGLVVLLAGAESEAFIEQVARLFESKPAGRLMSDRIVSSLEESVSTLRAAGAVAAAEGACAEDCGYSHPNTLLRVSAAAFLERPAAFQTEAFGNASLLVVAESATEAARVVSSLEGNLTGCIYSAACGGDAAAYGMIARELRPRVGRLLNDKMPTGVSVSPAMNHGGPYPATGHPHFTAVGIPASLRRFSMLQCFDGVRQDRLPPLLQDDNPRRAWRQVDGRWMQ